MSDLHRGIFSELPRSSKPSSRSQSRSRVKTPSLIDTEDVEGELNTQMLDELLLARVNSFQVQFEDNDTTEKKNLDKIKTSTITDIVSSLQLPLKVVSAESRQLLWAQLFRLTVFLPANPAGEINEVNLDMLTRQFATLSAANVEETLLATRAISAFAASDIDECATSILEDYFPRVLRLLADYRNVSTNVRTQLAQSFSALQLFVYYNAGSTAQTRGYLASFLELAEDLATFTASTDIGGGEDVEHSTLLTDTDNKQLQQQLHARDESQVIVSLLHGLGVMFTVVASDSDCNELIEEYIPRLLVFLENNPALSLDVRKAAGRVIALFYEIFNYGDSFSPTDADFFASQTRTNDEHESEDDEDNLPFYDSEYIVLLCAELATSSSKKLSRKDKKEAHSVFRDISATLEAHTSKRNRFDAFKQSLSHGDSALPVLGEIPLTKSKGLPIRYWFTFLRYITAKWCFGTGLQAQLVGGNADLKKILKAVPPVHGNENTNAKWAHDDEEEERSGRWSAELERRVGDKKKREQQLNKDRLERIRERVADLDV